MVERTKSPAPGVSFVILQSEDGQRYEYDAIAVYKSTLATMFGSPIAYIKRNNEPIFAESTTGRFRGLVSGATYTVEFEKLDPQDVSEVLKAHKHHNNQTPQSREKLLSIFRKFDADKNGLIDMREFCSLLLALGEDLTHADAERIFEEMDYNSNGFIDFEEFSHWWANPNKKASHNVVSSLISSLHITRPKSPSYNQLNS